MPENRDLLEDLGNLGSAIGSGARTVALGVADAFLGIFYEDVQSLERRSIPVIDVEIKKTTPAIMAALGHPFLDPPAGRPPASLASTIIGDTVLVAVTAGVVFGSVGIVPSAAVAAGAASAGLGLIRTVRFVRSGVPSPFTIYTRNSDIPDRGAFQLFGRSF